ncbi:MFS transporter [Actinoplanes sp. NPDC020271]|uniref:MFS transporter n=1 Tax=Actinoplanes sp. NPDC020271 TaxID=3363896 RepID=UPI003793FB7F
MTTREIVPLHRNRDFVLLWTGHWVSFLGSRMSAVCYPLLALWISGGSAAAAGFATSAAILPSVVFQLPAGALVDRWDRRRVMALCAGCRALALGAVAATLLTGRLTLTVLLAMVFVDTSLAIFSGLAERVTVRQVVPASQLGSAMGQNEARGRVAGLVGAPLGTLLFTWTRWSPFLLAAAGALVAFANVALMRADTRPAPVEGSRHVGRDVLDGFAWLRGHAFLRAAVVLVSLSGVFFQLVSLSLMVVLVQEQGHPASAVGLLFGISGCGGVAGALTARWWLSRLPLPAVVIGGFAAWGALMAGSAFVVSPVGLGALFAAMSFVGAVFNVASAVYQMTATPAALQGRVGGTAGFAAAAASGLGAIGAGYLLDVTGGATGLLVAAAGMAVVTGAALTVPAIRQTRLPAPEPEPGDLVTTT